MIHGRCIHRVEGYEWEPRIEGEAEIYAGLWAMQKVVACWSPPKQIWLDKCIALAFTQEVDNNQTFIQLNYPTDSVTVSQGALYAGVGASASMPGNPLTNDSYFRQPMIDMTLLCLI
ncbi:hypothetical protein ABZX51_007788 [Aspergillus tubingensis]